MRRFFDLDLLIPPNQIHSAERCIQELGYAPVEGESQPRSYYLQSHHHLPPIFCLHGVQRFWIEIQWAVSGYPKSSSLVDRVWERSTRFRAGTLEIRIPSPEDLFLHALMDILGHKFEKGIKALCDLKHLAYRQQHKLRWDIIFCEMETLNIYNEAKIIFALLDHLIRFQSEEADKLGFTRDNASDDILLAATECALHKYSDFILFWKLVACPNLKRRLSVLKASVETIIKHDTKLAAQSRAFLTDKTACVSIWLF